MPIKDRLAERVKNLNQELDRLRRENERLRQNQSNLNNKKAPVTKKALSLDAQSARKITSDTATPALISAGVVYVWLKVLDDVGARSFMGLTMAGFWNDPEILSWCQAGIATLFATMYKFVKRY